MGNFPPSPKNEFENTIFSVLNPTLLVDLDQILLSESVFDGAALLDFGYVHSENWHILKKELDKKPKEIRIHGCYYGNACTQNLAMQIFGYLAFGKHWYNWDNLSQKSANNDQFRTELIELSKIISLFNIKYGIVYSCSHFTENKKQNYFIPKMLLKPTLDQQLTDKKTEII